MHRNANKCCIVVVKRQTEHEGQKCPQYNIGETSYEIECRLFSRNLYIDDITFSEQTSYVRLHHHRQKVGNGPPCSLRNLVVKLLVLRFSAIDV